MSNTNFTKHALSVAMTLSFTLLTACGGGGGGTTSTSTSNQTPVTTAPTTTAPISTTTTTPITTPTLPTTAPTPEQAALTLLNANRTQCGFGSLTLNQALTNTATNHANYLKLVSESNSTSFASHAEQSETFTNGTALTNTGMMNAYYSGLKLADRLNPTTLGSKALATQYTSQASTENISMLTFSTTANNYSVNGVTVTQDMLQGLLAAPYHMRGLLYPHFKEVGINYQLANWYANGFNNYGSILELISALPANRQVEELSHSLNYPCDNVVTAYELDDEYPNPFGTSRNLKTNPVGQPVYVIAPSTKVITSATATITTNGQSVGSITTLTKDSDPNKLLEAYEVVFIPNSPLRPSTTYQASYQIKFADGTSENKTFTFSTQAKTN